jgi:flavin-dependent dehydrogenase
VVFDITKRVDVNAGIIPRKYTLTSHSKGGVAIVGDAAGTMRTPLNGGGIRAAPFSGRLTGEAAVKSLEAEDVSLLSEYDRILREPPSLDPVLWKASGGAEDRDDDLYSFAAEFREGGSATEPSHLHGPLTVKKALEISAVHG